MVRIRQVATMSRARELVASNRFAQEVLRDPVVQSSATLADRPGCSASRSLSHELARLGGLL